jgi:hypothetical protein
VAKGLDANYIHKAVFPVFSGKCLSCKAAHNWLENVSLMLKRLKYNAEVAETAVK